MFTMMPAATNISSKIELRLSLLKASSVKDLKAIEGAVMFTDPRKPLVTYPKWYKAEKSLHKHQWALSLVPYNLLKGSPFD